MRKCPKCGGTMKRRKTKRIIMTGIPGEVHYDLVCACCGYVKPTIR